MGRYEEANGYFKLAIEHESDDAIAHLCLGNAYLATGDQASAEETFNHIIDDHGGDLLTHAKWYLALSYLKQGKLERTRAVLWEISDSGTYGKEAKRLLKELD
jgi:tetratricopeptide (TPR) repeat protein